MTNDGILAIWHDVGEAIGDEYERWYFGEHLPERVGVPGFVAGRRYEAVTGAPRFLTYYEGTSPEVFVSKFYMDRLNDPTPLTTRVLRHFRDTNRTVCRRTWEAGAIRGAWGVAVRVDRGGSAQGAEREGEGDGGQSGAAAARLREQGRTWAEDWRVLRVELWEPAPVPLPAPTAEAGLRASPDRSIAAGLFAHFAREADARSAAGALVSGGPAGASDAFRPTEDCGASGREVGVYRLLCELRSD